MNQNLAPCGTDSAYHRHMDRRETADQACKDAHSAANGAWRRTNKTRVNEIRRRYRKFS